MYMSVPLNYFKKKGILVILSNLGQKVIDNIWKSEEYERSFKEYPPSVAVSVSGQICLKHLKMFLWYLNVFMPY